MSTLGVFRFWTFGEAERLVRLAKRIGVNRWSEVQPRDGFRWPSARGLDELPSSFASVKGNCRFSFGKSEWWIDVSPFDAQFPAFDWRVKLIGQSASFRRTIGSRILSRYLRNIHEYPSSLTVVAQESGSKSFATHFAAFARQIPSLLSDYPNVCCVGTITRGFPLLPPDSFGHRIEQTGEMARKVDAPYPVVYLQGAASNVFYADFESSAESRSAFPAEILLEFMPDPEYRAFLLSRGIYETSAGVLIVGSRQNHPLHRAANALLESTDRVLYPLLDETTSPDTVPYLLMSRDTAQRMAEETGYQCVGDDSRRRRTSHVVELLRCSGLSVDESAERVIISVMNRLGE